MNPGKSIFFLFIIICITFINPLRGNTAFPLQEDGSNAHHSSPPGGEELTGSEPVVTYLIEAQLYPKTRKLTGSETLNWKNTSQHPVDHLHFHLYYNAFRNLNTTFMTEGKYYKTYRSPREQKSLRYGEIKIKEIRRIGGEELTEYLEFIAPDDGNKEDRTVMELKLAEPVLPGQSIRLKIEFILTIPQIFSRTGAEGDYFFIAQWFPKIGVLQSNGQWNCHQFHYNSEFFADYGMYRVWLTVPEKFVIGATGNLINKEENADNTITYVFEENDIHDFAWTAYPHFTRITDTIQLDGAPDSTTIELLLSPGHESGKNRYLDSLKFALKFFAKNIFPYPYKKITVVDPPLKGIFSAGMEYPTLITGIYLDILPGSLNLTEAVTIHEFSHQYWYGIVGNDEFREAWLDEGLTSFFEMEIMEEYFKESGSLLDSIFIKIDDWEKMRAQYMEALPIDPVNYYSWKFIDRFQYAANVYAKAATFLRSMKNLVGKEQCYNFFKFYAQKYRFKHPTSPDFIDAFNTFNNGDFSWAFDRYIFSNQGLDQAVHRIEAVKISTKPDIYKNEAIFIRNEGYFPVELVITLENGKEIRSFWTQKENWKRISFEDSSPIKSAVIDPLYKVPLDRNFINNSKVLHPKVSGLKHLSLKIGFFFQNLLGLLIL